LFPNNLGYTASNTAPTTKWLRPLFDLALPRTPLIPWLIKCLLRCLCYLRVKGLGVSVIWRISRSSWSENNESTFRVLRSSFPSVPL